MTGEIGFAELKKALVHGGEVFKFEYVAVRPACEGFSVEDQHALKQKLGEGIYRVLQIKQMPDGKIVFVVENDEAQSHEADAAQLAFYSAGLPLGSGSMRYIGQCKVHGGRTVKPGESVELVTVEEGAEESHFDFHVGWIGLGPFIISHIALWPCGRRMLLLADGKSPGAGAYAVDFK